MRFLIISVSILAVTWASLRACDVQAKAQAVAIAQVQTQDDEQPDTDDCDVLVEYAMDHGVDIPDQCTN